MTIAIKPENLDAILDLAELHGTEATVVGKFTKSRRFHVLYKDQTVAYLDMKFLHEGVPQLKLKASWKSLLYNEPGLRDLDHTEALLKLLSSPNITTKESVIRRYDHEVKGTSVIKPIMLGPGDAAVIKPLYHSDEGLAISHGICPRYVHDGYKMAANAFDEALRNAIAAGARFGYMACLDNFSWPDPVQSEKTPDGEQKLGHLVRACIALYDCATSYGIPLISGKDSMKNDYYSGERKYSIPPTLLVTMVGKVNSIHRAMSSEFKRPGDFVYVLGTTRDELGGSELFRLHGVKGNNVPEVNTEENIPLYKALSDAIDQGLVASAHDISDGGLAVAFAESALGFGLGAELDLSEIEAATRRDVALLFGESAGRFIVSVHPRDAEKFEYAMGGTVCRRAGRVRGDKRFIIKKDEEVFVNLPAEKVREAYMKGI
jgi:phosphoribosylformylglycinamidine synthase